MVKCCVEGCRSNSKFSSHDVTFHRLPDARCFPNLYAKWLQRITGADSDVVDIIAHGTSRVCSLHFTEEDFVVKTDRNRTRKTLRVEAHPTLRLPIGYHTVKVEMVGGQFMMNIADYQKVIYQNTPVYQNSMKGIPGKKMAMAKRIKQDPEQLQNISRVKMNVSSSFAFTITPQESECGFNVVMINDNKYLQCDQAANSYLIWRCMLKSCSARIATSSVHCSILIGRTGTHCHMPTKGIPVNPHDWAPDIPQTPWVMETEPEDDDPGSGTASWSPDVGRNSPWSEQQCNNRNGSPLQQPTDTRFGVRDLLAPTIGSYQLANPQSVAGTGTISVPTLSSLDALSKFCGGEVLSQADPFDVSRIPGDVRRLQEAGILQVTYPRTQGLSILSESHPILVKSLAARPAEQAEFMLSPNSERGNVMADEVSDESSSGQLSSRIDEQPFYQIVDVAEVGEIIQKDPLSLEEPNQASPGIEDHPPMPQGNPSLEPEDAAFFQTLIPHLELLSPQDKDVFRKKVMAIVSQLTTKVTQQPYNE